MSTGEAKKLAWQLPCRAIGLRTMEYKRDAAGNLPTPHKRADGQTDCRFSGVVLKVVFDSMSGPADVFVPEEMYDELVSLKQQPTRENPMNCVLLFAPEVRVSARAGKQGQAYANTDIIAKCVGGTFKRREA